MSDVAYSRMVARAMRTQLYGAMPRAERDRLRGVVGRSRSFDDLPPRDAAFLRLCLELSSDQSAPGA